MQFKEILQKYQDLDPRYQSVNGDFKRIKRRTALQNILHRVINILTLGCIARNTPLDCATRKLIRCAEEVLHNSEEDLVQVKLAISRMLSLHITIIDRNGGKDKNKLQMLLKKTNEWDRSLSKVAPVPPTVTPQANNAPVQQPARPLRPDLGDAPDPLTTKAYRLIDFLRACKNGDVCPLTKLPAYTEIDEVVQRAKSLAESLSTTRRDGHQYSYLFLGLFRPLLKVARPLLSQQTAAGNAIAVISKLISYHPAEITDIQSNQDFWALFARGENSLQACTIERICLAHMAGNNVATTLLPRLNRASLQAWQLMGKTSILYPSNIEKLELLINSQLPEALIAFLNGLAQNNSYTTDITFILGHMLQPTANGPTRTEAFPLEQLSDEAIAKFNLYSLIPETAARNQRQGRVQDEDHLWHVLFRNLSHPQTLRQKWLFIRLTQMFFRDTYDIISYPTRRAFLMAMSPADIALLPLEQFPRPVQFILIHRSQDLQRYSFILQSLDQQMTEGEAYELRSAWRLCGEGRNVALPSPIGRLAGPPRAAAAAGGLPQVVVESFRDLREAADSLSVKARRLIQYLDLCMEGDVNQVNKLPDYSEVDEVWNRAKTWFRTLSDYGVSWGRFSDQNVHQCLFRAAKSLLTKPREVSRTPLTVLSRLIGLQHDFDVDFNDPDAWSLFNLGECKLQTHMICRCLYSIYEGHVQATQLIRLKEGTSQAWELAGERCRGYELNNDAKIVSFIQSQKPDSLVAFLNGFAKNPNINAEMKNYYISDILGQMLQPSIDVPTRTEVYPLERLSDEVFACFDLKRHVSGLDYRPFWSVLARNVAHPQTHRQKLLFRCLARTLFDNKFLDNQNRRAFTEAMTPEDIALLPLDQFSAPFQIDLALRSKCPQRYSTLLQQAARRLTREELLLLATFRIDPIELMSKLSLVSCMMDPNAQVHPPIVHNWLEQLRFSRDDALDRLEKAIVGNLWAAALLQIQLIGPQQRLSLLQSLVQDALPADTLALSRTIKSMSRPLFIMALFDDRARATMLKLISEGLAEESCFEPWMRAIEELSKKAELPSPMRQKFKTFCKHVKRACRSLKCPLRMHYQNPKYADVLLKFPSETIPAHRLLLNVDPFFQDLLSENREVIIPAEKCKEVKMHLKWLYNSLTLKDVLTPEFQSFLRTVKDQRPTIGHLFNHASGDVFVRGADELGPGVRVHRFIIESAFPFFAGLFRSTMNDAASSTITLSELSHDQVKTVLEYLYTGEMPEFADTDSEQYFKEAWDFLKVRS